MRVLGVHQTGMTKCVKLSGHTILARVLIVGSWDDVNNCLIKPKWMGLTSVEK
jgi:hypothetical protein